jgi:drug/metabolite transporter (DMT)-like permease
MVETTLLVVAVPAGILSAASIGFATAAQQQATHQVPVRTTLHPRLFVDLLRHPLWLLGLVATAAGFGLQVLALAYGPLILVQPLLVSGLLFAVAFSSWMSHRQTDRIVVLGVLLAVAGLATFLALARPQSGPNEAFHPDRVLPLALTFGAIVLAALVFSAATQHRTRVLALAVATGILFGITAGLLKVLGDQLRDGWDEPFRHGTVYAICVIGPVAFLLSQNTFQQGRLIAPAMAIITTLDPLVGVGIGVQWLGETVTSSVAVIVGEALATVAIIGGIAVVCTRGAHLLQAQPTGASPA